MLRGWAPKAGWLAWRNYDFQLTTYAVLLTVFGLAMAYSNSVTTNHAAFSLGSPFVKSLMWAVVAAVVFGLTTVFDYKWFRSFAWPIYLINIALLIFTLRFGKGTGEAGSAARWIVIGEFQLQFSELAKVVMIVVFAAYLTRRQPSIKSPWTIIGGLAILVPPWVLVMMQPDLGTSLVLVAVLSGLLFMSGASLFWMGTLVATVVASIPYIWYHALRDYQQARLLSLLNPVNDLKSSWYQVSHAQTAINVGGLGGKGLTNGTVDLPVKTTDFVW